MGAREYSRTPHWGNCGISSPSACALDENQYFVKRFGSSLPTEHAIALTDRFSTGKSRTPEKQTPADARTDQGEGRRSGDLDLSFLERQTNRGVDITGVTYRPQGGQSTPVEKASDGVLQVGRDIVLSGRITKCDTLVVRGKVEATSFEGRSLEVADTGTFEGSAQVDIARICGRFDGELIVRDRLSIVRNGRVAGSVRYSLLEVENGGVLSGNVEVETKE